MKKFFRIILIILFFFYVSSSFANKKPDNKKFMLGFTFVTEAVGAQIEFKLSRIIGLRFIGVYTFGLGMPATDYIFTGVIATSFYIPTQYQIVPVFFAGLAYSYHYWEARLTDNKGIIHDLTFGGGAGFGFNIIESFLTMGINLWLNYDYKTNYQYNRTVKGRRFILPLIYLDLNLRL